MSIEEVYTELTEVFEDVLDLEDLELKDETTAEDIEEWDSLNHVHLIVNIEKRFGIKFTSHEINAFKKVGDIVTSVLQKQ